MRLLNKLRHVASPYPSGLRWTDYARTRLARPLCPGSTTFMRRRFRYSDNVGFIYSVREVFADQTYRFRSKTEAPHIIDAGANMGLSVLYFKALYPKSTIVAFEPDSDIFPMLRENVAGLDGIELRQEAAWTDNTVLSFFKEGSLAGSSEVDFLGRGLEVQVSAARLKDELGKRPVDFLKIDIEGAENAVLFDIEDELAHVDHLFFEYHSVPGKPQRLGDMLNLVQRAGFRYVINGAHGPVHPFIDDVQNGFDLQLNVFCFRRCR